MRHSCKVCAKIINSSQFPNGLCSPDCFQANEYSKVMDFFTYPCLKNFISLVNKR